MGECGCAGVGARGHAHALNSPDKLNLKIMEWIPIVLVTFKLVVFGAGMFFAIKWHYDQGKKDREK